MTTAYLAAFGTLFCWTISTFALAKLTRLEQPVVLNKAVLFFSTFILGSLVCLLDGLDPLELFTAPTSSNWLWLSISGILGKSVGDYCGYQAMRILGVRRRTMITTLGPGFTWIFGLLILDETMNWIGVAAMFITLFALLLFINNTAEKDEVLEEKFGLPVPGLLFGIAAAGLTGLAFILSKMTIIQKEDSISAFHGTWIRIIAAFGALFLFDIIRNKNIAYIKPFLFNRQKAFLILLCIVFGAILGLSFSLMAITNMNAAAAYTIFAMLPVTVTIACVIFYRKKISLQSWLYSVLAIAGVLILVWREELISYF